MAETFFVYDDHGAGNELYAHRLPGMGYPGLGHEILTGAVDHDGHRSTERIGLASSSISHRSLVEIDGPDIKLTGGKIVGTTAAARLPRDHLIAAVLQRETEAIGKGYVPERHTDFDTEHGWQVTMEMGRGG